MSTNSDIPDPTVNQTGLDPENPWPGLLTFREADEAFFHGRKKETQALVRLVLRARLTVLFGVSGLGKSSLLHAGLFPKLRREYILPVYIRLDLSTEQPDLIAQTYEAIAAAAEAARVETPQRQPGDTLWEYFHRRDSDFWSARNRVVVPLLVFDQFEELFTQGRSSPERLAASKTFIVELADLVEERPPARLKQRLDEHPDEVATFNFTDHHYKVIFSLREDFLPDLEGLRKRIGSVVLNRLRLRRMTGKAALEVVNQAPHLIQPDVAERVVRSVAASDDETRPLEELLIEPALLSVVCRELNAKRKQRGETQISQELVEGSQKEIVSELYERGMAGLAPEVRIFVEEQLLTASGYRDSVAVENALLQPGITREDLRRLVDGRLIRLEERGEVDRVELTHDLLTGVIAASRDARHSLEAKAEELRARLAAEERERDVRRKLQRSRAIAAGFLALALLAAGFAGLAFYQRGIAVAAERDAQIALARTHLASAVRLVETGRNDQSLAYLGQALRADPTSVAARSWVSDLLLRKRWNLPTTPVLQHTDIVNSATFDRAAGRLLTASEDGTARLWNAATGEPLTPALPHEGAVYAAVFSPDEQRLATASADGTARLWDTSTGAAVGVAMRHDGPVYSVAFSADRQWLVTASEDDTARVWEAANGKPAHTLQHQSRVYMAVFGNNGQVLTASADGTARIWDAVSGQPVGAAMQHDDGAAVTSVTFSADGSRIATASDDDTARIWDTVSGQPVGAAMQHDGDVSSVAFAPDGRHLATASADHYARVWDLATGNIIGTPIEHDDEVLSAKYDAGGRRIATASRDGTARLWDAGTGAALGEPLRHDDAVSVAAFSDDGRQLLTASWDGTARAWKVLAVGATAETYNFDKAVLEAAFAPDGKHLLTAPVDKCASLWDVASATHKELCHDKTITSAAFSPGGRTLVTTSRDKTARVWDVTTGDEVHKLAAHDKTVSSAVFSPNGSRLCTTSLDDTARVWDVATGASVGDPMKHDGSVFAAAFSPEGSRVLTGSQDKTARIWNATTGVELHKLTHDDAVNTVAYAPDGHHVLTAEKSGTAYLWNTENGTRVGEPLAHEKQLSQVSFSPNGRQVLTASWDSSARLWDATTGAPIGRPLRHGNRVNSARYSPDGKRVVTASTDNTVQIWDAQTGAPVGGPLEHDGTVNSAAFSPDGRRLVSASRDKTARVWDVLFGSENDAELLAELGENVGGYEISALGTTARLTDQYERLATQAETVAKVTAETGSSASLARWMYAAPDTRKISPLSNITAVDLAEE